MEKHLFISCFIVFILNMLVLLIMFLKRVNDIRTNKTDAKYFKTYDTVTNIPNITKQLARNYTNLLEIPTLFYAIIAIIFSLKLPSEQFVFLAYAFAFSRVVHTAIHTTVNKIYPRLITFAIGCLILATIWIKALLIVID